MAQMASPRSFSARVQRRVEEAKRDEELKEVLPGPGDLINGRYVIERKIGQGQFGWVFAVKHALLGQRFAMKIMHPRIADDDAWVRRFREEARLTSLLGHENIVFVTDFDRSAKFGYYFVMEHLVGAPLSEIIAAHPDGLDPARAFSIALKTAHALSAVHELGIAHRDLKPSNVMLVGAREVEYPKIVDFGIASRVVEAASSKKLYGTPAYMAPEQTRTMAVDGKADQFSLATILYEMLCGHRPFNTKTWRDARASGRARFRPRPLCGVVRHRLMNEEVDAVIARALSPEPKARWRNMEEFAFALRTATGLEAVPSGDPRDTAASRPSRSAPTVRVESAAQPAELGGQSSVVVLVDEPAGELGASPSVVAQASHTVTMSFRTTARLGREWKRNLRDAGLFVPTAYVLPLGTKLRVRLIIEPENLVFDLDACVVNHVQGAPGSPGGFGARLEEGEFARALGLMRRLGIVADEIKADSIVRPCRAMRRDDRLSTAGAFLCSRLERATSFGEMRELFSGLPFALEETIGELVRKGLVTLEHLCTSERPDAGGSAPDDDSFFAEELDAEPTDAIAGALDVTRQPWMSAGRVDRSSGAHYVYDADEIEQVLELVEYFKRSKNYLGAIHVLRKALDVSPTVGEFYRQLAILHARFSRDMDKALRAIGSALQLEPRNDSFVMTERYLRSLPFGKEGVPPPPCAAP